MESSTLRSEAIAILKKHDLRPSSPRITIYSYLLAHLIHPGADTIYRALLPENPTLSLTTVYNTLKLFVQYGLVTPLTIEDGEVRYDVNTAFHAHFKCRVCGGVSDFFSAEFESGIPHPAPEYLVESVHLDFYGVCPHCREKKNGTTS